MMPSAHDDLVALQFSSGMRRVVTPEILDSENCPPEEAALSLRDLGRINRWFGGVATTQVLVERVARSARLKRLSLLEVASGFGDVPKIVAERVARRGIELELTFLDRKRTHLLGGNHSLVADALALPFRDGAFDLVSCNLFAHHLEPEDVSRFVREALRVSRQAVLINDLVRHRAHLGLVYAGFPLMKTHVSRRDGVASVRRAYVPQEMREIIAAAFPNGAAPGVEILRHYLFRMGVIVWK
jgi:SAM-dependent methyltransferase